MRHRIFLISVINTNWKSMTLEDSELVVHGVERRLNRLEQKDKIQTQIIKVNRQNIELIMQHIPELKKLKVSAGIAQDEYSFVPQDDYEDVGDEEDDMKD